MRGSSSPDRPIQLRETHRQYEMIMFQDLSILIVSAAVIVSAVRFLFLLVVGILVILLAGRFLSGSAGALIKKLNVPAWAVGWILGLVTSVCELASFIEIYRTHKSRNTLQHIKDTQEAIDALVASNVSNLGLILPLGMLIYLLVSKSA
ncbi:MAG: hypothetical protein ISS35_05465 [Kiritimatiellae bacterium]|nr:hypothetical protein [Kiritimatiellia bacterium]